MSKKLTREELLRKADEYIANKGTKCPFCGSDWIEGASFDVEDPGHAAQEVNCIDCGGEWVDRYTLTSVVLIQRDEEK